LPLNPNFLDRLLEVEIADVFALEDIFPSSAELFDSHAPISAADNNVMIALDTNALLLPYEIKAGNLKALRDVYESLSKKDRLYLPDRVIREFGRNRDKKLTDLIKALEDRRSKDLPAADMPPILETIPAYRDATKSRDELNEARTKYIDAIGSLIAEIKKWRGDDPVIKMYSEILKPRIVKLKLDGDERKSLLKEWRWRSNCEIPPGYKDSNKPDAGIGDFLIWKTLLHLGAKHKKHLVV
jgi:predicted nucleic acid-binding protein